MKVRWTKSSLRLRITPSELGALLAGEPVAEELKFPGSQCWRLVLEMGTGATHLNSDAGTVTLCLGAVDLARLDERCVEGVYFRALEPEAMRYCVEKDFPCIHPRPPQANEPETETFDPPA